MAEETPEWEIYVVNEVRDWLEALEDSDYDRMVDALNQLRVRGPALGRPMVDTIKGSTVPNLKELRQGTIRVLFAFDLRRACILLVAGDKANRWKIWYDDAIPLAEARYSQYLEDRKSEEENLWVTYAGATSDTSWSNVLATRKRSRNVRRSFSGRTGGHGSLRSGVPAA